MKELRINFGEIAMAMENAHGENEYFLDCDTGQLIVVPSDLTGLESLDDDEVQELVRDLPEWEKELVREVLAIYRSEDRRYLAVAPMGSHEAYDDMREFAHTVEDRRLRELLFVALDGRGAFGRFKRVLADWPAERERWFACKEERMEARIRRWLRQHGIEAADR